MVALTNRGVREVFSPAITPLGPVLLEGEGFLSRAARVAEYFHTARHEHPIPGSQTSSARLAQSWYSQGFLPPRGHRIDGLPICECITMPPKMRLQITRCFGNSGSDNEL